MKILNKCPICGGKLEYNMLCQYTNIYGIKRNGDLTERRKRKEDAGSMECGFIACTNEDFMTDCDLTVTVPQNSDITILQIHDHYYYEEGEE